MPCTRELLIRSDDDVDGDAGDDGGAVGFVNQPHRAGRKQSHLVHIRYITESILLSLVLLSQIYICFWLQNLPGIRLSPEL